MLLLVYTRLNEVTRPICSGLPDAKHYDCFIAMRPLLEQLGEVRLIQCPTTEPDALYHQAREAGRGCVLLTFTLPHQTQTGLQCPTIAVFDWGYDTVPDHEWEGEPRHDWRRTLNQLDGIITTSHYSASVLQAAAQDHDINTPITVIPVATADSDNADESEQRRQPSWLDSKTADFQKLSPRLYEQSIPSASAQPTSAQLTVLERLRDQVSRLVNGLRDTPPKPGISVATYECRSPNLLPQDGLQRWREEQIAPWLTSVPPDDLDGVIYTATQNPLDNHNLYHDLITAFCEAFRDCADATLVLHLEHRDGQYALQPILEELYRLSPFRCRVLMCIGEAPLSWWRDLTRKSHYHVHLVRGDGSCPRLLRMMLAGKPGITVQATASADIAASANSFIVASSAAPAPWPHDERGLLRTTHIRLDWQSLHQAFTNSYAVAHQPDRYKEMSQQARQAAAELTDQQRSVTNLRTVLQPLVEAARPLTAPLAEQPADNALPDPRMTGLKDITDQGWFNRSTGELCAGFPISADDRVLDFGCGAGQATLFCADTGAHVTFCDNDLAKLEAVERKVRKTIAQSWRGFLSEGLPLPVDDGSVNRVVCMEVLEHLEHPLTVLEELVRAGEPGALYLLTVPEARAENLQKKLSPPEHFEPPNHVQVFDRESFANLVLKSGLHIVSRQSMSFYWALWFTFYWSAQRPEEYDRSVPTMDQIQPPYAEVLTSWAETWELLREYDSDREVQNALNQLMPKSQVIIARKP